jgi:tetratricopeptide (TPR) repeat protein
MNFHAVLAWGAALYGSKREKIMLDGTITPHRAPFLPTTALFLCIALASCATTGSNDPDALSLDEAIEQSAREIGEALHQGTRVAIAGFDSQSANLSDYIMEELTGALIEYRLEVADRNNLAYVRKELNLQLSGEVSDETAQSIGKFVGAQSVITGQLLNTGGGYRFRIGSIKVETAVRETSTRLNVSNNRELQNLIAALGSNKTVSRSSNYGVTENTQPQTAGAFLDRGMLFAGRGDYDLAIEDYTQAIRLDTNNSAAYFNRGIAYYFKSDYDRAITDYTQAIKLDPNDASAYYNRGIAYRNKDDYDRAITDYTQAIKLDPNDAGAYNNRGLAYNNKGDHDRAIADYTQAIRLDPNLAMAYNNRGTAYGKKGDYDRAIADHTQAINLDPNGASRYYNRGNAYNSKGDYDRAIADYNQAIRLDPNNARAYNNRGNAYYNKGDYDRAIADYNQAIRLDPNDAATYYNRGNAYYNKGDYRRARADYTEALRLDPNDADARSSLERLRQEGH